MREDKNNLGTGPAEECYQIRWLSYKHHGLVLAVLQIGIKMQGQVRFYL